MTKCICDTSKVNISMTLDVQILLFKRTSSLPILRPGRAVKDIQRDRQTGFCTRYYIINQNRLNQNTWYLLEFGKVMKSTTQLLNKLWSAIWSRIWWTSFARPRCKISLQCNLTLSPWRNINWFWQLRFVKSFWFQWRPMRYQFFSPEHYFNDTAQFREDLMEIYI